MSRLSHVRTTPGLLSLILILAACGGAGEATTSDASTTTTVPALTRTTLPGGDSVAYPSDWISYGEGFSGSLELGIPGIANISIRDAAASEYLFGPQWPNSESLNDAFAMAEFGFAGATVGEANPAAVDSVEIIWATVLIDGTDGVMAVARAGGSFVSLYAASTDGDLPRDTVDAILRVLASVGG